MYILAIDQGTTGTTSLVINASTMDVIDKVNHEFPQIFPEPGWVEHNLNNIWDTVEQTVTSVLKETNIQPSDIKCIGITNQRETTCAFDRSGSPLANAIVWQDRRTNDFCRQLKEKGLESIFKKKAGLPLDPYFSGTKMHWLLNNNEQVKEAAKKSNLLFGTIDSFLLYKLSGNISHKTDASNASRTLLMDLESCEWDNTLMDHLGIQEKFLPEITDSFSNFGVTKGLSFLPDGIPITGILGDQQSALFGQACFDHGQSKCTYGTGAFMLLNTGTEKKYSENGLLTTVAYKNDNKTYYALEGSAYIAGACIQWLRDNLSFFNESKDVETEALKVKELEKLKDVFLFPFFTGIGTPYWNSDVKASLVGLTRGTGVPEISRAALEGVSFSINDLIVAFNKDSGTTLDELKVDGGAVVNNLWMQIQANISNLSIIRPKVIETTALGAAMAASIGAELKTINDLKTLWSEERTFKPESDLTYYKDKYTNWSAHIAKML